MSQLDLPMKSAMIRLPEEIVAKPASWRRAILMTADLAGFADKQAAEAMGVPQEMWSRFKTDHKTGINPDRIEAFMDNCGNELPLFNLAYRRGFNLVERETETQRLLRIEREARIKAEEQLRTMVEFFGGRVPS